MNALEIIKVFRYEQIHRLQDRRQTLTDGYENCLLQQRTALDDLYHHGNEEAGKQASEWLKKAKKAEHAINVMDSTLDEIGLTWSEIDKACAVSHRTWMLLKRNERTQAAINDCLTAGIFYER